ncbi:MAG: hypothetical protein JWR21_3373 [Herminiimonas sp.]|nr:hypothetical protein [Herminiimonas sp.]
MDVERMDFSGELEYVGFWARAGAALVDTLLFIAIPAPLLFLLYGRDILGLGSQYSGTIDLFIAVVLPALIMLAFWTARQATPGKMLISAVLIDERTAQPPSISQHIGRFLAFFLVVIPFGLGALWIAFDRKKQGWHDKLAGTVVVRARKPKRRLAAMRTATHTGATASPPSQSPPNPVTNLAPEMQPNLQPNVAHKVPLN